MKTITICLLLIVGGTCLLSTNANATAGDSTNFEDIDLDTLIAELDDEYVDVQEYGFIRSVRKVLRKALKSIRGVNCIVKEVTEILTAATDYVDAVDACGTAVPKDVAAIVKSCKDIITICNNIIHLNSQLCSTDDTDSNQMSSKKCTYQLFKATMKLARKINTTLKQIAKLPSDTSSCFGTATNQLKETFNNFLPNINACIDDM
ncbi:uncharacterized protein LOC6564709 [Drosophila grimshawi]|uniref:GH12068 n=1 Tax=Drosophila grimshawi TaxID=7222 RepID=B4JKE0_DROGR|nr:uncharacterized protein LOC6564709 [Drosophila grimshawi]EDW00043.1 GH12068 [Drosophila grimshawi]